MNMHQKQELSLFAEELYRYMSPATLNQLAIEAGGMKRKRKCHGHHFLSLCVWLNQQIATTSLTQLCSQLETSTGILLSPEGLNRRFNSASVAFFRTVFTTLLQAKIGGLSKISHALSAYFERILILDSTTFQVPDRFASTYPGAGGCSHKAGVKIQLEYDLLSGEFSDVKIEPGKRSDQAYGATRTGMAQKNELYIRDLGYFRLQDFKSIQDKQGYYLSRLKLPTKIYRKEFETVVFKTKPAQLRPVYIQIHSEDIMNQLQPGQVYELHDVYVGSKDKLPTRIVVYKCTEEQKQKRLHDRAIREKKKGITYTERTKLLQGITVYMTNIPTEWVPKEKIYDLYSLRWQIELLFKIWKSWFQIHRCKSIKQEGSGAKNLLNLDILILLLCKRCVISMEKENVFKWKHYQPEIILLTVRWYLRYNLSFRDLVEMMKERGLSISHTTIMRWVHQYGPELDKRIRRHLKQTNDSWRVDETYIKVKGQWMYLYRAVDSKGNTIDFYLSKSRDKQAAKRFFIRV